MPTNEHSHTAAENVDPLKAVEDVQNIIAAQAQPLLFSENRGNEQSVKDLIDQGPCIMTNLLDLERLYKRRQDGELEKLYKRRQDDLDQSYRQTQSAISDRTSDLGDLQSLRDKVQEQDTQIIQLRHDNDSLRTLADESSSKAQASEKELAVAQATIESLQSESAQFRKREIELQAKVDTCSLKHSDADRLRQQVPRLPKEVDDSRAFKIDFEAAKRIQESSIIMTKGLEQELNGTRRERDDIQRKYNTLSDAARENVDLGVKQEQSQREAMERLRRRYEATEEARDQLIIDKNELTTIRGYLERANADLIREKGDQSNLLQDTREELQSVTEARDGLQRMNDQLQYYRSSKKRSSLKRSHHQVDSDEEELPSADETERLTRRSGKAPELRTTLDTGGPSDPANAVRDSVSPEMLDTGVEEISRTVGPSNSSAGPLMNTTATIRPSDGVAFTISVKDIKLLNFSSDVLPLEVLQTLRRKFVLWFTIQKIKWHKVQSPRMFRSCIEARMERKSSKWNDDQDHACTVCQQRGRPCLVVVSGEQVLLLPRKAAADKGEGPADASYWTG